MECPLTVIASSNLGELNHHPSINDCTSRSNEMSHSHRRFLIVALVLVGLLIPTIQAFAAEPMLPTPQHRYVCDFKFYNGNTGHFEMEVITPWTRRGVPPPNKLWSGRVRNIFENPVDPPNPFIHEHDWDLAYKPQELPPGEHEVTIRKEGKQCKDLRVMTRRFPGVGKCQEVHTVTDCVGGGLENLEYQRCRSKYAWDCVSDDDRPDIP